MNGYTNDGLTVANNITLLAINNLGEGHIHTRTHVRTHTRRAEQYNGIYQYRRYPYKAIQKYFQTILSCFHVYPIKMASEVGCSEEFVTDSDAQGDTLASKKRPNFHIEVFFFETYSNSRPCYVNMPKCHLYQAIVAAKDSNPSILYSHLRSMHPEQFLLYIVQHASNKSSKQAKGQ